MSLSRLVVRRRRTRSSPDKPQIERIEHANLDRPGARLHPRAFAASAASPVSWPSLMAKAVAPFASTPGWAVHRRGPGPWVRG